MKIESVDIRKTSVSDAPSKSVRSKFSYRSPGDTISTAINVMADVADEVDVEVNVLVVVDEDVVVFISFILVDEYVVEFIDDDIVVDDVDDVWTLCLVAHLNMERIAHFVVIICKREEQVVLTS